MLTFKRISIMSIVSCFLLLAGYHSALAQQSVISGPRVPVEYSNLPDEMAAGCIQNGADPHQVLYTEPLDGPGCPYIVNTFDFDVTEHVAVDVDALANCQDGYFAELIAWPQSKVDLLLSFAGDLPEPPGSAVYYELIAGAAARLWTQMNLCNAGGGLDGNVEDVDGLELWGELDIDDANIFSLEGDPGGTSVWSWSFLGGPMPYISRTTIFNAVQFLGFTGAENLVDVDAIMVWDELCDGLWGAVGADTIVFSIRAAANWDGGELVVLPLGGLPHFLEHGGHVWDTGFDVDAKFSVGTEEVDGLEAAKARDLPGGPGIPTVSEWGLIILFLLLIVAGSILIIRRRLAMRTAL